MCQTGAVGRAKAGQDFREILGHYYGGARLEKLY
jgi:peptidoglycan hydrolase-like amidase